MSIGGGRASVSTTPTAPASPAASLAAAPATLTSSEIISMIKKGTRSAEPSAVAEDGEGRTASSPSRRGLLTVQAAPRDDMAMLGLAETIRAAHADRTSLALGLDSEAIITAMSAASPVPPAVLCATVSSPWAEIGSSAAGGSGGRRAASQNSLEAILPACYNVQAAPHAATRIGSFTEETLFYMFYGMPRDRMQEMAARELTLNRSWRYHRDLRAWIMPGSATTTAASMTAGISALQMSPSPSLPRATPDLDGAGTATYIVFDAGTWSKVRRELPIVREEQLEDRFAATPKPLPPSPHP